MRIAWFSNSPDIPTGYGVQTMQVASRMVADGHEVHVLGNFGHRAGVRSIGGITVWPEGVHNYSLDVASEIADLVDADVVFVLYDTWVLKDEWPGKRVIAWAPVDHYPPPTGVMRWCRDHEVVAMSHYGAEQLRKGGVKVLDTIWHGVEDVYHPTPSDARQRLGIKDSDFLVMMNAANIGSAPPRKSWSENLHALSAFIAKHDDAYVYLHTDLAKPTGVPLPILIDFLGIPKDRVLVAQPLQYRLGVIGDAEMARFYTAADVLLAVSKGEGFGVPVIEAMACGTPSIVSDFTAQPELVGDTGWLVDGQYDFDWALFAEFYTPFHHSIFAALEDAYVNARSRREACVERARLFRANDLYRDKWRPLLARIEAELKAPPRKGMSRGAKKRAGK